MLERVAYPVVDDAEAPCVCHALVVVVGVRRRVHICPGAVRLALQHRESNVYMQHGRGRGPVERVLGERRGGVRVLGAPSEVPKSGDAAPGLRLFEPGRSQVRDTRCTNGDPGLLPAGAVSDIGYVQGLRECFESDVQKLEGHAEQWDDGIRICDTKDLQRESRPSAHARSCARGRDAPCRSRLCPLVSVTLAERIDCLRQNSCATC